MKDLVEDFKKLITFDLVHFFQSRFNIHFSILACLLSTVRETRANNNLNTNVFLQMLE